MTALAALALLNVGVVMLVRPAWFDKLSWMSALKDGNPDEAQIDAVTHLGARVAGGVAVACALMLLVGVLLGRF